MPTCTGTVQVAGPYGPQCNWCEREHVAAATEVKQLGRAAVRRAGGRATSNRTSARCSCRGKPRRTAQQQQQRSQAVAHPPTPIVAAADVASKLTKQSAGIFKVPSEPKSPSVVAEQQQQRPAPTTTQSPPPPPPPQEAPAEAAAQASACTDEVVAGLAVALERMASLAPEGEQLTSFHCVRAPGVSIRDYLGRIRKFFGCSLECYVMGLLYIDRLIKRHPNIVVSRLSCHRLLICSMMLAAKFQDDVFYANSFYAKVGGLRVQELNNLEAKMVQLLDFRLCISPEEFELYRSILCKASAAASWPAPAA